MRNLAHLATRLYGVPLMLLPTAADIFGNTFQRILDGSAAAPGEEAGAVQLKPHAFADNLAAGSKFASKPYLVTDAGIGVVGIYGALLQRWAFDMASCTSMASYQVIKQTLDMMQADPDVRGILLEFDSPGGEVAGNFELARQMLARRGEKPIWSHVNEGAYSAAYSLAAASDRIVVPQAGSVGSIGVVMVHVDQSKRDERMGLAYTFIYAGARKVDFNSHAPLGKKAQELATAEVVRLYDMFAGHVAAARSLDVQAVIDTEAGVFAANDAKTIGLVDAIGGFDETLAELTDYVASKASAGFATAGGTAARHNHGGTEMSTTNGAAPNTSAATPPTPVAGVPEADVVQRETAARAAGAADERKRIGAILNHEAAAPRQKLAKKLAFDTDMSVEASASVLEAAAAEQGADASTAAFVSPLAAAMATLPNPAVGPDAAAGGAVGGEADATTTAKNVVALFNQAKGGK
jgi:signal peptide peptidase SppA